MKHAILSLGLALLLMVAVVAAGDKSAEKPWFDHENCVFCSKVSHELMQHMSTNYHMINDGVMSITVVDEGYRDDYAELRVTMDETGQEIMKSGEIPTMCRHCTKYGEFHMSGVNMEHVDSEVGDIFLMTSDDPEMVEELHEFGKRTNQEMTTFRESLEASMAEDK